MQLTDRPVPPAIRAPGRTLPWVLACACLLAGCGKQHQVDHTSTVVPMPAQPVSDLPGAGANRASKMPVPPMPPETPQAIAAGHTLFVKMNCAGCHSYTGKGWMGPDLTDTYWRYGGAPDDIYRSIYEGRPQGMPAWGHALPQEEIWQLVHYIRSLPVHPGGDPSTVSPATQSAVAIDNLPPSQAHEAAK